MLPAAAPAEQGVQPKQTPSYSMAGEPTVDAPIVWLPRLFPTPQQQSQREQPILEILLHSGSGTDDLPASSTKNPLMPPKWQHCPNKALLQPKTAAPNQIEKLLAASGFHNPEAVWLHPSPMLHLSHKCQQLGSLFFPPMHIAPKAFLFVPCPVHRFDRRDLVQMHKLVFHSPAHKRREVRQVCRLLLVFAPFAGTFRYQIANPAVAVQHIVWILA